MPYAAAPALIPADPTDGNGAQPAVPMVLFQHEGKIFQVPADQWKPVYDQFAEQCKAEHDEVVALAGCTSSAPNATKRGASITSCVVAPDARAIRALRAFSFHWKTI